MFEQILWWTAGISSGLFLLKLVAMIFGADHGGEFSIDVNADGMLDGHSVAGDIQLISVTTIVTFIMMGSWITLTALVTFDQGEIPSLGYGIAGGAISTFVFAWALAQMRKLQADGTLRDFNANGMRGKVYLNIPAAGQGEGQVELEVSGRVRTFRAVSEKDPIESFKHVVVVSMTSDHVLVVRPA